MLFDSMIHRGRVEEALIKSLENQKLILENQLVIMGAMAEILEKPGKPDSLALLKLWSRIGFTKGMLGHEYE